MKTHALMLLGLGIMFVCMGGQHEYERDTYNQGKMMLEKMATSTEERVTVLAGVASALRESAIENPAKAVRFFFTASAGRKWHARVDPDFAVQQQTDFFTGAILLFGSQNQCGGIAGLYNPWWDAILLLKLETIGGDDDSRSSIGVSEFHFVSGEMFRGESDAEGVGTRTVVPGKDPLSVELWRVCSSTRSAFESYFPCELKPGWGKFARVLLSRDMKREMERIQTRSVLRLQHCAGLLANSRDAGIAAVLTRLARRGNLYELYKHFRMKESRPLLRTFAELPEMFRNDFTPYCYLPAKDATLYVLVNKKVPRLYVTVSLPANPTAATSSMEWYDLMQCDELLAAWNNRKEVAK